MIIDVHTHPPDYHDASRTSLTPGESAEILLEQMQLAKISRCGLLGCSVSPGQTLASIHAVNDFSAAIARLHPERFFAMAFINPNLPQEEVESELDRCLSLPEFKAVKLELDVNCRSPRLDIVARKALEYDVPVLHHSWYVNLWNMSAAGRKHQQFRSEPHDVADFARRFPDLKIIMAHLEGSGVRGLIDIADCPNVWVDTSGSQPFSGTLEYGVRLLGSERILFGSDACIRSYETQLGRVLGSPLCAGDRENILYRNAATLFSF